MKNLFLILFGLFLFDSVLAQESEHRDSDLLELILVNDTQHLESLIPENKTNYNKSLIIFGKLALISPDRYSKHLLTNLPKTKKEAGTYYQITSIMLSDHILEDDNRYLEFQKFLSISNLVSLSKDSLRTITNILEFMIASEDYAWSDEFIDPITFLISEYTTLFFATIEDFEHEKQQRIVCPILELSPSIEVKKIKEELSPHQLRLFTCKD